MPENSSPERYDVALVALSARALCASARAAGLQALAFDLFRDEDTAAMAARAVRVGRGDGLSFDAGALLASMARHVPAGTPVVVGGGLEAQPDLLAEIWNRHDVVGNTPARVARLKDPFAFSALLGGLGIAHPAVYETSAPAEVDALVKRIGGAGGGHVRPGSTAGAGEYVQARVRGRAVSALFLADGMDLRMLGFSEQWTAPEAARPFRYGGAAGPIDVGPHAAAIEVALGRIVAETGLVGLNSADFMCRPGEFDLIEINPRPGATLDVFDGTPALLALHMDASRGRLPDREVEPHKGGRAACTVYADTACEAWLPDWPDWVVDRPSPGTHARAGDPVCTVLASARDAGAARRLAVRRESTILTRMKLATATAEAAA